MPEGLYSVSPNYYQEFADRMKLALAGDEVGVIIPEDVAWYTIAFLIKDDPMAKQPDPANLNKDEMMAWLERFTTDHAPRKSGTMRAVKLGSWTHTPTWHADRKTLTMGVRISHDNGDPDVVNYKVFLYGPENQILCLQTVAPAMGGVWQKALEAPNGKALKLTDEVTFPRPRSTPPTRAPRCSITASWPAAAWWGRSSSWCWPRCSRAGGGLRRRAPCGGRACRADDDVQRRASTLDHG